MRRTLVDAVNMYDDGTAFVLTGDIPAMWLRDSAALPCRSLSGSRDTTSVPIRGRRTTKPSLRSIVSTRLTVIALTENSAVSSASEGSRSPTAIVPGSGQWTGRS